MSTIGTGQRLVLSGKCKIEYCDRPAAWEGSLCRGHLSQRARGQELKPLKQIASKGSGHIDDEGYRRICINGKRMKEHRYVMEQHLGRALYPDENIHHINGDRADNRLENLEIWNISQPPGQRVDDKVEYALEILSKYRPELLSEKLF